MRVGRHPFDATAPAERGGFDRAGSAPTFGAFPSAMDATGWWEVEVPTPLGRLRFDVRIRESGEVTASYRGRRIPVPAMRTTREGDGLRVRWTQHLTVPVRIELGMDALVVGDRLTGTATAGSLMPPVRLQGRRVA